MSVAVNDLCTEEDIANSFAEQCQLLYTSVISDPSRLLNIYNVIIASISTVCMTDNHSCGTFNDHSISYGTIMGVYIMQLDHCIVVNHSDGSHGVSLFTGKTPIAHYCIPASSVLLHNY